MKPKSAILNAPISNEVDPRQYVFVNYLDPYGSLKLYQDGHLIGGLNTICGCAYLAEREDAEIGQEICFHIESPDVGKVATQSYIYKETSKNYALYYVNAYGGWDTLAIQGNVTQTDNIQSHTYKNKTNGKVKYLNTITPTWQLYTDDMNDGSRMHHLLGSTEVYLHNLQTDEILPVVITDTNCVYKTYANQGNKRFHYAINVEASNYNIRK